MALQFADVPDPSHTRADHSLARIASSWMVTSTGGRFVVALRDWLRSARNPRTLAVYARACLDFFDWYESEKGVIPTPDQIRRADVAAYEGWLRGHTVGLVQHRLDRDDTRRLDAAIHTIVSQRPGSGIDAIRASLLRVPELTTDAVDPATGEMSRILRVDRDCRGGLADRLSLLTRLRVLDRTPTVSELRAAYSQQARERGEPVNVYELRPSPSVFQYRPVDPQTEPGPGRSSGAITKLAVLSSLWTYLSRPGSQGDEPLVRYNYFADRTLINAVRDQGKSFTVARRQANTPDEALFRRVLALTYRRSHGDRAYEAASAAAAGEDIPKGTKGATFADLRDRALLLVMLQAGGPRASEIGSMKRQHLAGNVLTIYGKGGKVRTVPVPPPALDALHQLEERLRQLAKHNEKYGRNPRSLRLLDPGAPLIPAIKLWGSNAGSADAGLSRQAILERLHRLAERVGSTAAEIQQLHPHGVRRLYARMDLEAGTPLPIVQRKMGHASGSTTMAYAEEVDPSRLVSKAFQRTEPVPREVERRAPIPRPAPIVQSPTEVMPSVEEIMQVTPPPLLVRRAEPRPVRALGGAVEVPASETSRYMSAVLGRPLTPDEGGALGRCDGIPEVSGRRLCGIYAIHWGERGAGSRTRVTEPAREVQELERSTWGATRSLITTSDAKRLVQVYAGVESGLPWWAGTQGDLPEELPIPSPAQVGACGEGGSALCASLSALWQQWVTEPEEARIGEAGMRVRGPTAARALVAWVSEALDVAGELDAAVSRRGGSWVAPTAEWPATAPGGSVRHRPPRMVFREHSEEEILGWFERQAWQHRTSRGEPDEVKLDKSYREPKTVTAPLRAPAWYGSVDPIADLPPAERAELLDLISILTGQGGPADTTGRFQGGLSRATLAPVLDALRAYERSLAEVRDAKHGTERGEASEADVVLFRQQSKDRLADANQALAALGHPVNVSDWVKRRSALRRSASSGRESIATSHLGLLGELFGTSVAVDPIVALAVSGGEKTEKGEVSSPLGGYKALFRIDRERRTIVHEEAFKRSWASEQGTHSECVARRSARELWELWQLRDKPRPFERRQELIALVRSLSAYRVPCPGSMEQELRDLLGGAGPRATIPIYEVWRLHTFGGEEAPPDALRRMRQAEEERRAEMEEHLAEVTGASEYGGVFGGEERRIWNANPRGRFAPVRARSIRAIPNPVQLLFAASARYA